MNYENQKNQIDLMIANFNSLKAEIARRSNLQKAAILAYLGASAWIFQKIIFDIKQDFVIIVVFWLLSFLTMSFVLREGLEIGRLGGIIDDEICKKTEPPLITSDNKSDSVDNENAKKRHQEFFNWTIFLIFPLAVSLMYFDFFDFPIHNIIKYCAVGLSVIFSTYFLSRHRI